MKKNPSKQNPTQCPSEIELRATASLKGEIKKELGEKDRPLKEILDEEDEN